VTTLTIHPERAVPKTHPDQSPVRVERHGDAWRLTSRQFVPVPRDEVFPFFADAHNLEAITPAFLNFNVLTPRPIEMRAGARIDYRLRLRGVPIRWKTLIPVWDPPRCFVDRQISGPYKLWLHEHTFDEADGGTIIGDTVDYDIIGGPLAPLAERLFVRNDVVRIFNFRRARIAERFGSR